MRIYDEFKEIVKIQKFRRLVSYSGFYCFATLISYFYVNNTTRAGFSRADQFYASYPAGTELLTDTTKLYKAALGNCFEAEEWGPFEFCVMAKHFERQGKSPYAYHARSLLDLALSSDTSNIVLGICGIFKKMFRNTPKVWDCEKLMFIPDHYIFPNAEHAHYIVDISRKFCVEQDIKYFYAIQDCSNFRANPDCKGTGKVLLKVPPALRFVLEGEMPCYLLAKGLILHINGEISMSGASYKGMKFVGTTIENLSMEERMAVCNMVVEAVGKNSIVVTTYKYLGDMTLAPYEPVFSDENARFLVQYRFNASKMEPLVTKPHSSANLALVCECNNVKIDRVDIASFTGGKTEDFMLQQMFS
ncbi:3-isopropylmalate dehydratase large subunit, chloroplastic isoform B [Glycine soja]|uniref:3-isopropylmalate dehydratase large subunit, chloroplastic isoform A n=1 Tax=Glycine soja TaxID=3848 RepID=A0A445GEU3_GLYSO|nr:3-isopropylmalate dehydratase large subunit, chloroplastic isoform A [Glycine soja]RZB59770.1 3-isopropylmalate dehydratase large subunit, chloroplastic isoform B [Glycine soja]